MGGTISPTSHSHHNQDTTQHSTFNPCTMLGRGLGGLGGLSTLSKRTVFQASRLDLIRRTCSTHSTLGITLQDKPSPGTRPDNKTAGARSIFQEPTFFEHFLRSLLSSPILPFGFFVVKPNTRAVMTVFGKIVGVADEGLHYMLPAGGAYTQYFVGTVSRELDSRSVVDATGNPLVVSAMLNFSLADPALLHFHLQGDTTIVGTTADAVLRQVCAGFTYDQLRMANAESHHDMASTPDVADQESCSDAHPSTSSSTPSTPSNPTTPSTPTPTTPSSISHSLDDILRSALHAKLAKFGISVDVFTITDLSYAPIIAQQMLMTQQAKAYADARAHIADAAVGIARGVSSKLGLGDEESQRLMSNLVVSIVSQSGVQPTLPL